jgi:hypothetical protein
VWAVTYMAPSLSHPIASVGWVIGWLMFGFVLAQSGGSYVPLFAVASILIAVAYSHEDTLAHNSIRALFNGAPPLIGYASAYLLRQRFDRRR